jgi:hypothetical protein
MNSVVSAQTAYCRRRAGTRRNNSLDDLLRGGGAVTGLRPGQATAADRESVRLSPRGETPLPKWSTSGKGMTAGRNSYEKRMRQRQGYTDSCRTQRVQRGRSFSPTPPLHLSCHPPQCSVGFRPRTSFAFNYTAARSVRSSHRVIFCADLQRAGCICSDVCWRHFCYAVSRAVAIRQTKAVLIRR